MRRAECVESCPDTDCDALDGCQSQDYYDYKNVSNTCEDCICTQNECGSPTVYTDDQRCKVLLEAKIFLEGPFSGGFMSTSLDVPFTAPYQEDPRSVDIVPGEVTDWVLV